MTKGPQRSTRTKRVTAKQRKNLESVSSRPLVLSARVNWFRDSSAQNHFGPGLLGPDVSAHFQSGTARSTLVGPLGPFLFIYYYYYFFFLGGDLLFYSVYVHQNKIQETLFNVILIFRQGNREIL